LVLKIEPVMSKIPHTYTVLRYVHDTGTAEFANVGVVLTPASADHADTILRPICGSLAKRHLTADVVTGKLDVRAASAQLPEPAPGPAPAEAEPLKEEPELEEVLAD